MKLRNILIAAATMGVMFASTDRTNIVGYTAGDYSDMNKYAHKAAGQNVAFTSGTSFETVWTAGGTTWGFAGGTEDQLLNMLWSNGTFGLSFDLDMEAGESLIPGDPGQAAQCVDLDGNAVGDGSGAQNCADEGGIYHPAVDPTDDIPAVDAATTMTFGLGMNIAGYDVGFKMGTADGADMNLYARGGLNFWAFDTMEFNYMSNDDVSHIDVNMYGVKEWGAATGMFAMGFESTDMYMVENADGTTDPYFGSDDQGNAVAATLITTTFSVESTLTDWCDLRIGYDRKFDIGADNSTESWDAFSAGVGFNLGSVQLDMTLSDGTLGDMMSNPLNYISGYNSDALTSSWTLSYTW